MATFTNKATLTYNGITTDSNTVTGNISENLSISKEAVNTSYTQGESVTYAISLVNTGTSAYNGITLTDDLGSFTEGTFTLVPLTYIDGSVSYYVNGVLQAPPTVTAGESLAVSGINVPAGGNAIIIYRALANEFARIASGSVILNTVSASGAGISTPINDSESLEVESGSQLTITKSLSPTDVPENGELTYTLVIENSGNEPAEADANIVVSDLFDPAIAITSVTLGASPLALGSGYTYDESTGAFATIEGVITVPAATYTVNSDGSITTLPGSATLIINGIV